MPTAQGMLTAMKQEVTRKHKAEKWALDDVVYHTEVTSYERMEQVNTTPHNKKYNHAHFEWYMFEVFSHNCGIDFTKWAPVSNGTA